MLEIPNPIDCGLPEQFDSWRTNQEHAITVLGGSDKRFTALSAPTGFGKSAVYIAHALLSGQPTCIVTNSRGLQDQLLRDFKECGLVDIRGRANYQCEMREDYSCQEGYVARCPYKGTAGCPSSLAEMKAAASSLVVTNYDKWTSCAGRFGEKATHFTQVVFDEGHDAPDAVAKTMQVILSPHEIEKILELDYPIDTDNFGCWRPWAARAGMEAESKLKLTQVRIDREVTPKSSWIKEFNHLKSLIRKLGIIATARERDWVVETINQEFVFDPVFPARYAESVLFLHIPRIIVVSATLRPKTMFMMGVTKDLYDFQEFPSDFDPRRCPVYYVPTMRVDSKAGDLGMLWMRLDQIIAKRQDRKGIIHTISYQRQQDLKNRSRFQANMICNDRGIPATSIVEVFKASKPGSILVSPSVSTGYDFPGKDCEWQFICKIPFPDGRSRIMRARSEVDKEYGAYQAAQTLVQSIGRGMRSKTDQCESFLCDDHLQWFMPRYSHLMPDSFRKFYRTVQILPQPPERLP